MIRRSKLSSVVRSTALLLTLVLLTSCDTPKYASDYPLEKGQVKKNVNGDLMSIHNRPRPWED